MLHEYMARNDTVRSAKFIHQKLLSSLWFTMPKVSCDTFCRHAQWEKLVRGKCKVTINSFYPTRGWHNSHKSSRLHGVRMIKGPSAHKAIDSWHDRHNPFLHGTATYRENPLFNSLVWGLLLLAPMYCHSFARVKRLQTFFVCIQCSFQSTSPRKCYMGKKFIFMPTYSYTLFRKIVKQLNVNLPLMGYVYVPIALQITYNTVVHWNLRYLCHGELGPFSIKFSFKNCFLQ